MTRRVTRRVTHRVTRRHLAGLALGALAALTLSGCSGAAPAPEPVPVPTNVDLSQVTIEGGDSNGVWFLPGSDALEQVFAATRRAGSVVMSGTFTERLPPVDNEPGARGRTLSATVTGSPGDYRASVTAGAVSAEIVVVAGAGYVRGNDAYAADIAVPEAAQGFVCVTADDPVLAEWYPLVDPGALLEEVFVGDAAAAVSVNPPASADQATVDFVLDGGGAPFGTLVVSAVGEPLPQRLVAADASGDADLTFTEWGAPHEIVPPTEVVRPCG